PAGWAGDPARRIYRSHKFAVTAAALQPALPDDQDPGLFQLAGRGIQLAEFIARINLRLLRLHFNQHFRTI
ncbi:hypothetical protein CK247_31285, partial [Klebsiella pneumoniae]